jgi:3-isopropylmalate/(R)-2-methylmalate dehydratase large subunit
VVVTDHFVPAIDVDSARILKLTRGWVRISQVDRIHDMQGICHVVITENGHVRPGMFTVGGDSHSPTAGAFVAFMFGVGATEMVGVLATGEIWIKVPETQLIRWHEKLGYALSAKDMNLATLKHLKLKTLKYGGDGIA